MLCQAEVKRLIEVLTPHWVRGGSWWCVWLTTMCAELLQTKTIHLLKPLLIAAMEGGGMPNSQLVFKSVKIHFMSCHHSPPKKSLIYVSRLPLLCINYINAKVLTRAAASISDHPQPCQAAPAAALLYTVRCLSYCKSPGFNYLQINCCFTILHKIILVMMKCHEGWLFWWDNSKMQKVQEATLLVWKLRQN